MFVLAIGVWAFSASTAPSWYSFFSLSTLLMVFAMCIRPCQDTGTCSWHDDAPTALVAVYITQSSYVVAVYLRNWDWWSYLFGTTVDTSFFFFFTCNISLRFIFGVSTTCISGICPRFCLLNMQSQQSSGFLCLSWSLKWPIWRTRRPSWFKRCTV